MKKLACADAGFTCNAVILAETEDEILNQAAAHAQSVHNTSVTPEMAAQIKTLITEA